MTWIKINTACLEYGVLNNNICFFPLFLSCSTIYSHFKYIDQEDQEILKICKLHV